MPKIVIMAGGTGGHVFPGLAVADELKQRGWQIEWFGTADKMEAQLVPQHSYNIHFLSIAGVRGKGLMRKLSSPFVLFKALMQARKMLKDLKPDVVLGMGGYASGPGGLAAYTLGIPLLVHEQNAVFGLTNRYLAKLATLVMCGFDTSVNLKQSKAPKHTIFVGNPVRASFASVQAKSEQPNENVNILIVGGSLGALALNQIVPQVLSEIASSHKISIKHQSGKGKLAPLERDYQALIDKGVSADLSEFIDDIEHAYDWADIIICRAGALTVAEISVAGRAAIFVPLPIAVDDHQTQNAENLAKQGAALIIQQNELKDKLPNALSHLCTDTQSRHAMAQKAKALSQENASARVADYCQSVVGNASAEIKRREKV